MEKSKKDCDGVAWTCQDEFKWIREQLSNHIPSLIRGQYWKFLVTMVTFGGIIVAILKLVK